MSTTYPFSPTTKETYVVGRLEIGTGKNHAKRSHVGRSRAVTSGNLGLKDSSLTPGENACSGEGDQCEWRLTE